MLQGHIINHDGYFVHTLAACVCQESRTSLSHYGRDKSHCHDI